MKHKFALTMIGYVVNILSLSANTGFPVSKIDEVIKKAETYYGARYKWGGESYEGLDCSGLIVVSFRAAGIRIAHNSRLQAKDKRGKAVEKDQLQRGDLLFFRGGGYNIGHVALVTEVNKKSIKFIHSSSTNEGVQYNYLHEHHWKNSFVTARRFFREIEQGDEEKEPLELADDRPEIEIVYNYTENEFQIDEGGENNLPEVKLSDRQFPQASKMKLSKKDLKGMSPCEIKIMKNEIYAQYGYKFHQNGQMIRYFNTQSWYRDLPKTSANAAYIYQHYFTSTEKYNVQLLIHYEGECNQYRRSRGWSRSD